MVEDEKACVELQLGRIGEEIKGGVLWGNVPRNISSAKD
jgi:hypothetical protein